MSKALVSELLKKLDWEIRTNRLLAELNNYLNLKDSLRTVMKHAVLNSLIYSKMQQAYESLQKLTPICSHCKNVNTSDDDWQSIENYLYEHTGLEFSHTICPQCMDKLYPEIAAKIKAKYRQPTN
ncbi:MAG TPA: hypothetical protein GXX46_07675 [Peptococcaceae bacterium]|nr:hypothetical protein [Peptococcaceae bacterium]